MKKLGISLILFLLVGTIGATAYTIDNDVTQITRLILADSPKDSVGAREYLLGIIEEYGSIEGYLIAKIREDFVNDYISGELGYEIEAKANEQTPVETIWVEPEPIECENGEWLRKVYLNENEYEYRCYDFEITKGKYVQTDGPQKSDW